MILKSKMLKSHIINKKGSQGKRRLSVKAIFTIIFYLIIPAIAIPIIIISYPELADDRLLLILMQIIPISLVLIFIAQYQVRFKKGEIKRLFFNELYVAIGALWLIVLVGGGPVIHQTWEEYHFSLHIWKYLALIFFVMALNVIFYILEYYAYRDGKADKRNVVVIEDC